MKTIDDPMSNSLHPTLLSVFINIIEHPTQATIAFFDRKTRAFSVQSQHDFLCRAFEAGRFLRSRGVEASTPVVVACSAPESALMIFCAAVLIGAVPTIVASRPAFDSRQVVSDRIKSTRSLLRESAVVVSDVVSPAVVEDVLVVDLAGFQPLSPKFTIESKVTGDDISHVQLTSGSTGNSKGIAVTHRNVTANCEAMATRRQLDSRDVFLSWLPLYHDMGLIGNALLALFLSADLYLMSPFDFLSDPAGWLKEVSLVGASVVYSPSSGYELALSKLDSQDIAALSFRSLRYACCGGEPVRANVARRFEEILRPAGLAPNVFAPSYGLAEATLGVTIPSVQAPSSVLAVRSSSGSRLGSIDLVDDLTLADEDTIAVVSVGTPLDGCDVHLSSGDGRRITDDLVCGEVVVSGEFVAKGVFTDGGRLEPYSDNLLRTGDIGFFASGNLYILDRIKDVVIRNGENYSTYVIEQNLADLLGISVDDVWVTDVNLLESPELTAVIEMSKRADIAAALVTAATTSERFEPSLESVLVVRKGSLPRTTSGKKRHSALRALIEAGSVEPLASTTLRHKTDLRSPAMPSGEAIDSLTHSSDEETVTRFVIEQLRRRGLQLQVMPSSTFKYDFDFDSMAMLDLALGVEELLGVQLPQRDVVAVRTVTDLFAAVAKARSTAGDGGISGAIARLESEIPQMYRSVEKQTGRDLVIGDRRFADFASCNYLSLDLHPSVEDAIMPLIAKWGVHPSWTRAVASPAPYRELESEISQLVHVPDCVVFPTVSLLHFGVLPALAGLHGSIFVDAAAHHSLHEASQLARAKGATVGTFAHGDLDDLCRRLGRDSSKRRKIIVVDGVYSMSGAPADLASLQEVAHTYDAILYVDDAHGIGVLGADPSLAMPYGHGGGGVVQHLGLDYERIVYVGGLSKAFSSMAAFVTTRSESERRLFERTSTLIFGGPIPVASLATALAGLRVNRDEGDQIRAGLWSRTHQLLSGLTNLGFEVTSTAFPILNVVIGDAEMVIAASRILWEAGILMTPSVFPAMPINSGGVRFTLTSANTEEQVDLVLRAMWRVRERLVRQSSQEFLQRSMSG